MDLAPADLALFEARATEVARILRSLANERRLMIVCKLVEWGEANVGTLADAVGLSQSALSQHLAKLREDGVVATRRESQTIGIGSKTCGWNNSWPRCTACSASRIPVGLTIALMELPCRA